MNVRTSARTPLAVAFVATALVGCGGSLAGVPEGVRLGYGLAVKVAIPVQLVSGSEETLVLGVGIANNDVTENGGHGPGTVMIDVEEFMEIEYSPVMGNWKNR